MDCLLYVVSRCLIVPALAEAGDVASFDPAAHHKPCRKVRGEEEERSTKATIDHGGRNRSPMCRLCGTVGRGVFNSSTYSILMSTAIIIIAIIDLRYKPSLPPSPCQP